METTSIVYSGPHPEVVVDEFDPERVIVNGEPVDVPSDLAERLLQQDTWALSKPESKAEREKREQAEKDQAEQEAAAAQAADEARARVAAEQAKRKKGN